MGEDFGGYNNLTNTLGIGDVVPAGMGTLGSGDRFDTPKKSKKKTQIATKAAAPSSFGGIQPLPTVVYCKSKSK